MKKQLAAISLMVSCLISCIFVFIGIHVTDTYSDDKTNWHFITGFTGTVIFLVLLIISLAGFFAILFKREKHKNSLIKTDGRH